MTDIVERMKGFLERGTIRKGHIFEMLAEIERHRAAVHSCHEGCDRAGCVNQRLRAEVERLSNELLNHENADVMLALKLNNDDLRARNEDLEAKLAAIERQCSLGVADANGDIYPGPVAPGTVVYARPVADKALEPLGACCYGGQRPKSSCASCGAWKPVADKDAERIRETKRRVDAILSGNASDVTAVLKMVSETFDAIAKGE